MFWLIFWLALAAAALVAGKEIEGRGRFGLRGPGSDAESGKKAAFPAAMGPEPPPAP